MVEYKKGNILDDDAEALVNTVNCVGVMGKGIALQFKQAFPDNYRVYREACRRNEVQPGKMFIYDAGDLFSRKFIINFPTKRHWRGKSRLEDIELGLRELGRVVKQLEIKSIAIPPLGCGNGGLDWKVVRPKIEAVFAQLPDVKVHLYEPEERPVAETKELGTEPPKMTKARAILLSLMKTYAIPGYKLSLLEIQKLAYFIQEIGEPLRLKFVKGQYGPYAHNLNFVLQRMEGHYTQGYGDGSRGAQIGLIPEAYQLADKYLEEEPESRNRLEDLEKIIFGFETPYGLELLSTVHWIAKSNQGKDTDLETIFSGIQEWNDRKRRLFKYDHVQKAWEHLKNFEQLFHQ